MGNHRSSGAFCSLVVATTTGFFDSVAALSTSALGDGAECYCVANASVYRLNLTSTQATVGDIFLAPFSGSGCWFKQDAQSQLSSNFTGNFLAGSDFVPTVNVWHALPATSVSYSVAKSSLLWTINAATGTMTYTGPDNKTFLILGQASIIDGAGTQNLQFDLTVPSVIGTNTVSLTCVQGTVGPGTNNAAALSHQLLLTVLHGDVYQHAVRCTTASPGDLFFLFYSATIVNVGN